MRSLNTRRTYGEVVVKAISRNPTTVEDVSRAFQAALSEGALHSLVDSNKRKDYFSPQDLISYQDILNAGDDLTEAQQAHKTIIERSRGRFTSFLNNSKNSIRNFDLVIYVSDGIGRGYANDNSSSDFAEGENVHRSENVIYLPPGEFTGVWLSTVGRHSNNFAVTGVHEFGHIFGNLADEYYSFLVEGTEATPTSSNAPALTSNNYRNNCFRRYISTAFTTTTTETASITVDRFFFTSSALTGSPFFYSASATSVPSEESANQLNFDMTIANVSNPWTHDTKVPISSAVDDSITEVDAVIADYGDELYPGCNGEASFRGAEHSIMNSHYTTYTTQDWPDGWGPINTFFLERNLANYQ